MAKLTTPINLDKTLKGKIRQRVYRVGVELEGGWDSLPKGTRVVRDGSIHFDLPPLHVGELPSPPYDLETLKLWLRQHYPPHVNITCGMHVHLSFKTAFIYQRLMSPAYPSTILAYMTRWATDEKLGSLHPLWERLRGNSIYCQHQFFADEQVRRPEKDYDRSREGHRYTVVNYPYSRTSTLECRLLPMMDTPELAIRAIEEIVKITNAFLVASAKREETVKAGHLVDDEMLKEERRSYV
jgi:hypothetical protein